MNVQVFMNDGPEGLGEVLLPCLPIMITMLLETLMAEQRVIVVLALLLSANELDLLAMEKAGLNVHIVFNGLLESMIDYLLRFGLTAKNWH